MAAPGTHHLATTLLLISGLAIATAGDATAQLRPFDPALCETATRIPYLQQYGPALDHMGDERSTFFTFPRHPELGVFVHDIFIKDAQVELDATWQQRLSSFVLEWIQGLLGLPAGFKIYGDGDGRGHDSTFDPSDTRAFLVLDFEKGQGYVVANNSQAILKDGLLGVELFRKSFIGNQPWRGFDAGTSWFYADWVDSRTFRVRYHLQEAIWSAQFVISAIDAELRIDRSGYPTLEHDRYPSYGVYHYRPCTSTPIVRVEAHQEGVETLGDTHVWRYPGPVDASPPPPERARLLVVGDSITSGQGGDFTWRFRLHEHLRARGSLFDFVGPFSGPRPGSGDYAVTGWDDAHDSTWGRPILLEKDVIRSWVSAYEPDVLLVHLGTNDLSWFGRTPDEAAADMLTLVSNARRQKPDVDFILVQIGDTAYIDDGLITAFNQRLAQLAAAHSYPGSKITVAPVAAHWNHVTDTYDGTHPNARGDYVIAKHVADTLFAHHGFGGSFGGIPLVPPPPRPTNVVLSPGAIKRNQTFNATWNRVVNPGIWTEYQLQVRYHQAFGFGLVWESPGTTSNDSLPYTGSVLPQTGVYHVVVVAVDQYGQRTMSEPVPLSVNDGPAPPPAPSNVRVAPALIGRDGGYLATWDRVTNPGIWTEYKTQLRYHHAFGFGLLWEGPRTPDLWQMYDGPRLPQIGVYDVVVVAVDPNGQETMSEPVPIEVQEAVPPPLPPANVRVSPGVVGRTGGFTTTWDRVPNPNIWTEYRVQLRYHQAFGFGLVWESGLTAALEKTYDGSLLPQSGVYHVVVVARDSLGQETMSEPVELEVQQDPPPPPPPTGVALYPEAILRSGAFFVAWDRVVNPGVWTEYKVQVRYHEAFGFGLVWQMPGTTPNLSALYTGPPFLYDGVYRVVVIARDAYGQESTSAPMPLRVSLLPPLPPAPQNVVLLPARIRPGTSFSAVWNRVENPGIWTEYKMQVRNHPSFGGALVWESPQSHELIARYEGPSLTGTGVYHVIVIARDSFGQEVASAPAALTVSTGCGLGGELVLLAPFLAALGRRRGSPRRHVA